VSELIQDSDTELARDSDVKRRMLALEKGFSESELGFPKFSRFLRQAQEDGAIQVEQRDGRSSQIRLNDGVSAAVSAPATDSGANTDDGSGLDPGRLRLPTGRDRIVKYLSNSYGGVGARTAETLVDAFGDELFLVLQNDPSRVEKLLTPARAESVLAGWKADFLRRSERHAGQSADATPTSVVAAPVPSPSPVPSPLSESAPDPRPERRGRRTRRSPEPAS
jgi:hypothetical protein